jgi:ABC-type uncharacterized transport system substrate-binding protein
MIRLPSGREDNRILHTSSETNSDATIAIYKELAPKYDFEIVDSAISQLLMFRWPQQILQARLTASPI